MLPKSAMMPLSILALTLWLAVFMAGAALAVYGLRGLFRSLCTRFWRCAPGEVTDILIRTGRHSSGEKLYIPVVTYGYQVNGVPFSSQTISLNPTDPTVGARGAPISRYAKGKPVRVLYHPGEPARSVLEHTPLTIRLVSALSGIALMATAVSAVCCDSTPPVGQPVAAAPGSSTPIASPATARH